MHLGALIKLRRVTLFSVLQQALNIMATRERVIELHNYFG